MIPDGTKPTNSYKALLGAGAAATAKDTKPAAKTPDPTPQQTSSNDFDMWAPVGGVANDRNVRNIGTADGSAVSSPPSAFITDGSQITNQPANLSNTIDHIHHDGMTHYNTASGEFRQKEEEDIERAAAANRNRPPPVNDPDDDEEDNKRHRAEDNNLILDAAKWSLFGGLGFLFRHHFLRRLAHHLWKTFGKVKAHISKTKERIEKIWEKEKPGAGEAERVAAKEAEEKAARDAERKVARDAAEKTAAKGSEAVAKGAAEKAVTKGGEVVAKNIAKEGAEKIAESAVVRVGSRMIGKRLLATGGAAALGALGVGAAIGTGLLPLAAGIVGTMVAANYLWDLGSNYFLGGHGTSIGDAFAKTNNDYRNGFMAQLGLLKQGKVPEVAGNTASWLVTGLGLREIANAFKSGNAHQIAQTVAPVTTFIVDDPERAERIANFAVTAASNEQVRQSAGKLGNSVIAGADSGQLAMQALANKEVVETALGANRAWAPSSPALPAHADRNYAAMAEPPITAPDIRVGKRAHTDEEDEPSPN